MIKNKYRSNACKLYIYTTITNRNREDVSFYRSQINFNTNRHQHKIR